MGRGGWRPYEGSRIETAFRSIFYRSLPRKTEALAAAVMAERKPPSWGPSPPTNPASSAHRGRLARPHCRAVGIKHDTRCPRPKHEYEIVVCHMNVIRYFVLRASSRVLAAHGWLQRQHHPPANRNGRARMPGSLWRCRTSQVGGDDVRSRTRLGEVSRCRRSRRSCHGRMLECGATFASCLACFWLPTSFRRLSKPQPRFAD